MNDTGRQLKTDKGPVTLRPERPDDEALLFRLFRSWALDEIAQMPVDDATKENIVRFQFAGQTVTYRGNFPAASFDIIEREGEPEAVRERRGDERAHGRLVEDRRLGPLSQ